MEEKKCAVCGDGGVKLCTGCHVIRYCSKEHQKEHWKEHKLHCKAFKEQWNVEAGHHFVASRDLKPGTIILEEDPLVIGVLNDDGIAICLGCCRNLDGHGVGCPHCSWPMCGRNDCWAEGSQHAIGECSLLEGAGDRVATSKYALTTSTDVYYGILVLRCLSLLKRDPAKWDKLMNMKDNTSSKSDRASIIKLVNQWLPEAAIPEEYVIKICNAVDFGRSFELSEAVLVDGGEGLKGIYCAAGIFDDSHIPNATASFTKDARMVVRAAVPIAKGAKIMVNYGRDFRWAMSPRMIGKQVQQLGSMGGSSHRKVPTEVNEISSWMYCSKCPDQHGILRPVNPLLPTTDWKCDTCSDQKSAKFIAKTMDGVMKDLTRLDRTSIPECEAFLSKYRKILHVHHSFMADTKMDIVCNFDEEQLNAMNEEMLEKRITTARELLVTFDVLSPGLNRLRGYLLYQLYIFLNARIDRFSLSHTSCNESKARSCLKLMAETLKEVVTIFSWESELTLEGRMAQDLKQRLVYVEGFIRAKGL